MLQQTQAKTVIPYYDRFLKQFPDIESLARSSEQETLELWSGLGYYSRARNIHKAAGQIVKEHGGVFPAELKAIRALPGIGRYTAGAICSLAFNQPEPVVDGNVRRVLARLNAIGGRVPESLYWNHMSAMLPNGKSSSFNQAVMELGAMVCVPFQPLCPQCPVKSFCKAQKLGIQSGTIAMRAKRAPERLRLVTLVLQQNGRILLTLLDESGFIPGKWGLPCQIMQHEESAEETASVLCKKVLGRAIPLAPCAQIRHSISHHRMVVCGFYGEVDFVVPRMDRIGSFRWVRPSSNKKLITSSLFHKVLQKHGELRRQVE
jgi:A/G-specific adenine glycosylase